jgi:hypothetical protein
LATSKAGLPDLPEIDDLLGSGPAASQPRPLAEWHDLKSGELAVEWAELRAWVRWLSGRYELSVEERLPRCWVLHPGLVEELRALRAWREEIYASGQAGMGQAARYWHAELRTVIHAAATMYAAGCRTGHRGAAELASISRELRDQWGGAWPLAGIPAIDITAGQARRDGDGWASGQEVAAALDAGDAITPPGNPGVVTWDGACWAAASSGWVQEPGDPGPDAVEVHHEEARPWMTR